MTIYPAPGKLETFRLALETGQSTLLADQQLNKGTRQMAEMNLDASSALVARGFRRHGETVILMRAPTNQGGIASDDACWLAAASDAFSFWDNADDAIYDEL